MWSEMWSGSGDEKREEKRAGARVFRRALTAQGLKFHNQWLRPQGREILEPASFDQARDWVQEVFGAPRENWPDGLLITNDILTRDVMPALQKLEVVANRDIIIASHANTDSPVLRPYEDDLTLIEYDSGEIVQAMFDQLETLLRGESVTERNITIKPKVRV
jgi:DNA-binding LacI/PurR family transcriptional regulator